MGKIAFLYAGQGSQVTGMGQDFYDVYPSFKTVYDEADPGFDLKKICFDNPDNMLLKTEYTQPCMVAFACGVTELLYANKIKPDYVCGLSLGEYSALEAAGVWSALDTIRIASYRGRAMADASNGIETGMTAIIKMNLTDIEECCTKASVYGVVSVCNLNCPGQIVIGGEKVAVDKATEYAKEKGARRCVPLQVSGPFHTSIMKSAGDKLASFFKGVQFNTPQTMVLYNYLGGPNTGNYKISDLLVKQVQNTVRMEDCIRYLFANDVDRFIEIGPGQALSGFVKKTARAIGIGEEEYLVKSITTVDDFKEVIHEV